MVREVALLLVERPESRKVSEQQASKHTEAQEMCVTGRRVTANDYGNRGADSDAQVGHLDKCLVSAVSVQRVRFPTAYLASAILADCYSKIHG